MSRARSVADLGNQNVLSVSATNGNINVGTGVTLENTGEAQFSGVVTAPSIDTRNLIGNVSIGGVLTYEDVTSVDSVGVVTARQGIHVLSGISTFAGITTVTGETLFTKQLNVSGVSTLGGNVVVGGATTELVVTGDARVTGILTVGTASLTLDGATGNVSGASLHDTQVSAISKEIADSNVVDVFVYDTSKDSDGGAWRKRTKHTSWYNETLNTDIRGSRREFPAVAVIVTQQQRVTIYDGDDPDLPMWMVLNKGASGSMIYSTNTAVFTSITAVNGNIYYGMSTTAGAGKIEFINDSSFKYRPSPRSNRGRFNGNIADRALTLGWNLESTVLVNEDVNDVAMTVLPNAPIDDTTGLPIPTIAVATNGGVSVIKDDGIIVDKATTSEGISMVAFTDIDKLIAKNSNVNYIGIFDDITADQSTTYLGNITDATFSYDGVFESDPRYNYPNPTGRVNNNADAVNLKDKTFAFGVNEGNSTSTSNGFNILQYTTGSDTDNNGILVGVTTSYNTGWMHGDIKGAFLSDTDTTDATQSTNLATGFTRRLATGAPSRVTSDTYDNGDVSWQVVDNASTNDGFTNLWLNGTEAGKQYVITLTVDNNPALSGSYNHFVYHTASSTQDTFTWWNNTGAGTLSALYTSQNSVDESETQGDYFTFYVNDVTVNITNFSVREATEKDRSAKNNGLQVTGTVPKQVVATGADLVSYGPFTSSSPYKSLQQPHNSDFLFGTSDWCISGWVKNNSNDNNVYEDIITFGNVGQVGYNNMEPGTWFVQMNKDLGFNLYYKTSSGVEDSGWTNHASGFNKYSLNGLDIWYKITITKRGNRIYTWTNDDFIGSEVTAGSFTTSSNLNDMKLTIGYEGGTAYGPYIAQFTKMALWKISKSAPSPEQIKKMYEDEKVLFQPNAKATLHDSSDAVTALAFDEDTELLHVGTSAGRSEFQGLRRINNTTDAVTTAISASNDLVAEK